jgi:hypothetical protein
MATWPVSGRLSLVKDEFLEWLDSFDRPYPQKPWANRKRQSTPKTKPVEAPPGAANWGNKPQKPESKKSAPRG